MREAAKGYNDRGASLSGDETELERTQELDQTKQTLRKLFNGDRPPSIPMRGVSGTRYEFNGTDAIGRLVTGRAKDVASPIGI